MRNMTTKEIVKRLNQIALEISDLDGEYESLKRELDRRHEEVEDDRLDRLEEERKASKYGQE